MLRRACGVVWLVASVVVATVALAEVGVDEVRDAAKRQSRSHDRFPDKGAYEVTITPPPLHGHAPIDAESSANGGTTPGQPDIDARHEASTGQRVTAPPAVSEGPPTTEPAARAASERPAGSGHTSAASRATGTSAGSSPVASAAAVATARATGPRMGFQVGAFREQRAAEDLRDKLAATFEDVYLSEVRSGGEPLYRVRVGRVTENDEAASLRKRLIAAGYPAFPVSQ